MNKENLYRFYYHYHKAKKSMTVHFKNQCLVVKDIICNVPTETKWNKVQPNLVIQGWCKNLIIENNKAIIE